LVLCAFGGLIALLWAAVASFEVWSVPTGLRGHRHIPKWEWHNRQFILAIGVVFLDTMCLLPACFLFVIHTAGQDVDCSFELMDTPSKVIATVYVVFSLLLGLVQLVTIAHTSHYLHKQQEAINMTVPTSLPRRTKVLVFTKLFVDFTFFVLQFVVTVYANGNTGADIASLAAGGANCLFLVFVFKHYFRGLDVDTFTERWRQATILQCFFAYVEFWVSFLVFLLQRAYDADFFDTVNNRMPDGQRALLAVGLATLCFSIFNYIWLLFFHARCMATLNSLRGFARLEGMDTMTKLNLTQTFARPTVVEKMVELEEKQVS